MSKIEDFIFYGKSGTSYEFEVYPIGTKFNVVSGVYIYTKRHIDPQNNKIVHTLLYIGETDSFKRRIHEDDYGGKRCTLRNNPDCICVRLESESNRSDVEQDLIDNYTIRCNRTKPTGRFVSL